MSVDRYFVVDDLGRVLNPMIVRGQIQGGVVQGIGQALMEHQVYDRQSGQLLSGSFMDYGMPRADVMPNVETELEEVPCKTNPLGVKGIGESGTIGAPPTVINALIDALAPLGVDHIDMPATPARVWETIKQAKTGTASRGVNELDPRGNTAVASPRMITSPAWLTAENSQSISPSPLTSRLAETQAMQVSTSPGQNRDAKRMRRRCSESWPSQSVSSRAQ